ncbi:hypothetical protein NDA01_23955 [Trichocoleus desertorum AS-A10]|uniref:hypothetical protein n=1 Tax=Trichocoleus desertorum TaxID=1481672 RepID=UPI003299BAE4
MKADSYSIGAKGASRVRQNCVKATVWKIRRNYYGPDWISLEDLRQVSDGHATRDATVTRRQALGMAQKLNHRWAFWGSDRQTGYGSGTISQIVLEGDRRCQMVSYVIGLLLLFPSQPDKLCQWVLACDNVCSCE